MNLHSPSKSNTKINSTQILGFILIMFVFCDWPFPHMCTLQRMPPISLLFPHMCTLQRMPPISLLILGSVFSDYVVFYGDFLLSLTVKVMGKS